MRYDVERGHGQAAISPAAGRDSLGDNSGTVSGCDESQKAVWIRILDHPSRANSRSNRANTKAPYLNSDPALWRSLSGPLPRESGGGLQRQGTQVLRLLTHYFAAL